MEPTRNANEARKEAEGESPDVKPHASFRATQRTSAGGGKGSEVNSARVKDQKEGSSQSLRPDSPYLIRPSLVTQRYLPFNTEICAGGTVPPYLIKKCQFPLKSIIHC